MKPEITESEPLTETESQLLDAFNRAYAMIPKDHMDGYCYLSLFCSNGKDRQFHVSNSKGDLNIYAPTLSDAVNQVREFDPIKKRQAEISKLKAELANLEAAQ